jgi:hypothetical protein
MSCNAGDRRAATRQQMSAPLTGQLLQSFGDTASQSCRKTQPWPRRHPLSHYCCIAARPPGPGDGGVRPPCGMCCRLGLWTRPNARECAPDAPWMLSLWSGDQGHVRECERRRRRAAAHVTRPLLTRAPPCPQAAHPACPLTGGGSRRFRQSVTAFPSPAACAVRRARPAPAPPSQIPDLGRCPPLRSADR